MYFDLHTGKDEGTRDCVWRGDSWLHFNASGGMASILMVKADILAFALFLRDVHNHPHGSPRKELEGLQFDSGEHDLELESPTVNILIGASHFLYSFNIQLSLLESFAQYLEANAEDAES